MCYFNSIWYLLAFSLRTKAFLEVVWFHYSSRGYVPRCPSWSYFYHLSIPGSFAWCFLHVYWFGCFFLFLCIGSYLWGLGFRWWAFRFDFSVKPMWWFDFWFFIRTMFLCTIAIRSSYLCSQFHVEVCQFRLPFTTRAAKSPLYIQFLDWI